MDVSSATWGRIWQQEVTLHYLSAAPLSPEMLTLKKEIEETIRIQYFFFFLEFQPSESNLLPSAGPETHNTNISPRGRL